MTWWSWGMRSTPELQSLTFLYCWILKGEKNKCFANEGAKLTWKEDWKVFAASYKVAKVKKYFLVASNKSLLTFEIYGQAGNATSWWPPMPFYFFSLWIKIKWLDLTQVLIIELAEFFLPSFSQSPFHIISYRKWEQSGNPAATGSRHCLEANRLRFIYSIRIKSCVGS